MSERHKFNGICDHAEDKVCPHYEESILKPKSGVCMKGHHECWEPKLRDSDKCSECGYWNPDCKESE